MCLHLHVYVLVKLGMLTFEIRSGTLTVDGTTKYVSSDNFDIQLKINSPELGIQDYELKGLNKLQGKQRTMEFTVRRKSASVASIKSTYERKESRNAVQITGNAQVVITEADLSGSLKYAGESRAVDTSDEKGIAYKLEAEVTSGDLSLNKLQGDLKLTNKETSGRVSVCASVGDCHEASFGYKDTANKPAIGKEAYVLIKTTDEGKQQVQGLRMKLSHTGSKFEQSVEVRTTNIHLYIAM